MRDYKIEMAIKEARKRGALLGTLETMDWFIDNGLADFKYIHEMIKEAIKKDKEEVNKKHD